MQYGQVYDSITPYTIDSEVVHLSAVEYVTLPGIQSPLIFAAITTTIFTLKSFEQVYIITGGGPLNSTNLLVYYIYDRAFARFDFGYAAAAAMVLLAFTSVLVYLQLQNWNQE